MSKKTSYLLGILFTIIIGTLLYCYFCDECHCFPSGDTDTTTKITSDNEVVKEPDVKVTSLNPFTIKDDNGDLGFTIQDNFNFNSSRFKYLDSVSANVDSGVAKIKDYLEANNSKRLDIIGHYTSGETNNSAYPNLGLARANSVKNYFVSKGVDSKYINTSGKLDDALVADANNVFRGPVSYNISTIAEGDSAANDALKAKCDAIKAAPLVLYFKTGQASINLTAEQRQKIADMSNCVDKLGMKIQVIGHTDNTGNAANNMTLGQNRADFAKRYLVRNGILGANIEASSQGPNKPIASNATDEGRAKNRRTVVTIN